jgi:signal transduction histidine kinase
MRFFAPTLQRKTLLLLLLVGFVPAAAGIFYLYWGSITTVDSSVGAFLHERADSVALNLDHEFASRQTAIVHAADDATSNPDEARIQSKFKDEFPELFVLRNADDLTTPLASMLPVIRELPAGATHIEELLQPGQETGLLVFAARGKTTGSPIVIGVVPSDDLLQFHLPTREGLAVVRIFSNSGYFVNDSAANDIARNGTTAQISSAARRHVSGFIKLSADKRNPLIAGYAASNFLRKKQREGSTSLEWTVIAEMAPGDIMEVISQFLWQSFLFGIPLAIILLLLSFWLSRRILRPMRVLQAGVNRLASGDYDARVQVATGDEIEELAGAFNTMAESLMKSRTALQLQIERVEKNAQQIALMNRLARSIVAEFDLGRACATLHPDLQKLVNYDAVSVVLFRAPDDCDVYAIVHSLFVDEVETQQVRLFCEEHLLARKTTDSRVPSGGFPAERELLAAQYNQFCLAPLQSEKGLTGAILLARLEDHPFSNDERRVLSQVSQIFALAAGHIRLFNQTRDFAAKLEHKVRERTQELEQVHGRMLQAERFAATGRLAANIAHEVNNPLGIIKNYVRLLRDQLAEGKPADDQILSIVNEELDRIARIVKALLDFYKPSKVRAEAVQINAEIEQLLALMAGSLRKSKIVLQLRLGENVPEVICSSDHVRQILLNLLKNAEDSIVNGGTILIETSGFSQEGNDFVSLKITDTGCGIGPEDLPRIFEPFFTTKRDGQGTGLGLSVTYGLVRNWGGSIEVESRLNGGTTMTVLFPVKKSDEYPITVAE